MSVIIVGNYTLAQAMANANMISQAKADVVVELCTRRDKATGRRAQLLEKRASGKRIDPQTLQSLESEIANLQRRIDYPPQPRSSNHEPKRSSHNSS